MRCLAISVALSLLLGPSGGYAGEWKPVTDAELQMKAPQVQKDADAEAIFWEVKVHDEAASGHFQTTRFHYLRLKIFTERGRDQAKVELTYGKSSNISGVSGRTIKPDGTITDMKKDAVFDSAAVRGKTLRLRSRSFTLPDVQPGDIIEYQWKEVTTDSSSNYLRLPLQRSIPVQTVRYFVKPVSIEYSRIGMQAMSFHVKAKPFVAAPQGYSLLEYTNMPAFREEPYMPPEDELLAWALVFYSEDNKRVPEKYWSDFGRKIYGSFRQDMKVNGDIKKAAAAATEGATTDEEKVHGIYKWVRKNAKNLNGAEVSAEDRRGAKENHSSVDTLKQSLGTGYDVNILFAALATAAGLDARMAMTGDRGDMFFSPSMADRYFLSGEMIAVKIGGAWKYYDPATSYLPCGFQVWEQQGTAVLIPDAKQPEWVQSALSKATESLESHIANFKLDEDGTLSGNVQMKYTGHLAIVERRQLLRKTATEREQYLIDEMKQQFAGPEITGVTWEGIDDAEKPVTVSFTMKTPGYVQKTGKRIFIQPAVFQRGDPARFPNSTREHPVYFHYPWSESDEISIEVPEGYEFDHPDIPPPIKAGETITWKVGARIENKTKLVYKREFSLGDDGNIILPQTAYPNLKRVFDAVHEGDEHAFALKQTAGK